MKKLLSVFICAVMLLTVCASCSKDEEESYDTRTARFYAAMDKDSFWYKAHISENNQSYTVTQATNGSVTTTIEDHDKNSADKYQIYDGYKIQSLNFPKECYDTIVTKNGVNFRFAEYKPAMFAKAASAETEAFGGVSYYCETFEVVSENKNVKTAFNKYYFDGDRLAVIQIIENDIVTLVIQFEDYSNTIPGEIYLEIPEGFSARNYIEENEMDFSDIMSDWLDDISGAHK